MVNTNTPKTLPEALRLLAAEPCTPYAGGTELMVPEHPTGHFLFLHKLPELRGIEKTQSGLRVGACCSYAELLESPLTPALLKQAIEQIAAPGIRGLGTMGGNVCNASPAGDTLPILYLYNAQTLLAGLTPSGEVTYRRLPIAEFIKGVRKTALAKGELLVALEMEEPAFTHSVYEKVGARAAQAIAKLSFAAGARVDNGKFIDFRAAFGAVGPTVIRREDLEAQVVQKGPGPALAALYEPVISPIDDQRSTAEYRKAVCLGLLEDFLQGLL